MASATTIANLLVRLQGDVSDFESKMSSATGTVQKVGQTMRSVGTKMTMGVTAPLVALGGATLKTAADFESSMAVLSIAASSAGLSMSELHDAAITVGGDASLLGVSASGAAESMTGLYKAGLSTTEIFGNLQGYMEGTAELGGALRASIDLAAASELDMVQASDLAAVALATFGGHLESEAERADFINMAMNNMVQAADASVASVSGLAAGLQNVGPVASSMGMSLQDTNNALAILSTRGIEGAEAGTALKSMITNLRRPTDDVTEALSELNVSLYDAEGTFVGMPEVIGQLEDAFGGLTQEQRDMYAQTIAGTYGINALNTLVTEGVDGWYAMAEATGTAAGIQEQATARASTLKGQMEALMGGVETLAISIGEVLIPYALQLVDKLKSLVEWMNGLPDPVKKAAVAFAAVAAAIGPLLVILGSVIGALSNLGPIITAVTGALGGLLVPIALVAAAAGALYVAWEKNFLGIRDITEDVFGNLRDTIPAAMEQIKAAVSNALGVITGWFEDHWTQIQDITDTVFSAVENVVDAVISEVSDFIQQELGVVVDWVQDNWPLIQETIETVLNAARAVVETVLGAIQSFWQSHGDAIMTAARAAWDNIKVIIDTVLKTILGIVKATMQVITGDWEGALETMQGVGQTIWKAIQAIVSNTMTGVKAVISSVLSAIQSAWSSTWAAIKAKAEAIWEGIKSAISNKIQAILADIKAWLGNMRAAIAGYASSLYGAGVALIQGLINGIRSKFGAAIAEAKRIIQGIINTITSVGQMESPSKVTMEMGKDLLEGLIIGLDLKSGEALDKVKEIVTKLIDAFSALADLGSTLSSLGGALEGLGTATTGGTPSSAFEQITLTLERLAEWARMLQGTIADIATQMPEVKEKTLETIDAVADATDSMDGLLNSLLDFGDTLRDISSLDAIKLDFRDLVNYLFRLRIWAGNLYTTLMHFSAFLSSSVNEAANVTMDAVSESVDSLTGVFGSLLDLGDVLRGIESLEYVKLKFRDLVNYLFRLRIWAGDLYTTMMYFATFLSSSISKAANETMDAVAGAVDSLTGILGSFLDLGDTLRSIEELTVTELTGSELGTLFVELSVWMLKLYEGMHFLAYYMERQVSEAANDLMDTVASATDSLTGMMDSLLSLGDTLRGIEELTITEFTTGQITALFWDLKDWAEALYTSIYAFALLLKDDISKVANDAMDAATTATDALTGMMGSLLSLGDTLRGIEELTITELTSGQLVSLFWDLKDWIEKLYTPMYGFALLLRDDISEVANKMMDAAATSTNALTGMMGALLSFAETLGKVEKSEVDLVAALAKFESMSEDLKTALRTAWNTLLPLTDLLTDWTEECESVLVQKMEALSGALRAAFGPINNAVSLLSTLANAELPDLAAGFAEFELSLSDLESTMQYAFDALEGLLGDDGIVIEFTEDEGIWLLGEQMGVLASAISAAFGPLGNAVSFLSQLASDELPDLTIGFEKMQRVLRALKGAMRNAYDMLRGLLEDPNGIIVTFTEEGAWLLGDKIDALSKAIQSAFGPISGAVDLLSTLAEHRLQDLREAFGKLGAMLPSLRATARMAYEMMRDLAEQELTDWEEGASELADKTVAMGDAVSSAFGGINSAIGALSGLIDLMWAMGTIAGTEHLEAADFQGLIIGVNMLMEVLHYSMQRLKAATRGLDLESLEGVGESLKIVGDGLKAMADGMQAMVDLVAPTVEGTESVVDGIETAQTQLDAAMDLVTNILTDPPWADASWAQYGYDFVETLVAGIYTALPDLEEALNYLKSFFPASPARRGPLSKPINWSFLSDGLSETMGYIRAQMSLPDLTLGGAGADGNRYYDMTFNYPPNTPLDLKRQMELVELTDRYKR